MPNSIIPERKPKGGAMEIQLKSPGQFSQEPKSPSQFTHQKQVKKTPMANQHQKEEVMDRRQQATSSTGEPSITTERKYLHPAIFALIILMESAFTLYPSFTFSRAAGVWEFVAIEFSFSIAFILISYYLVCRRKKLLKLYSLLDPLLIIQVCLSSTYIFPFYALSREEVPEIMEQIGFVLCNFCMVGNFRVFLLHMKWSYGRLIAYKLIKVIWILFYLFFGAYYVLASVSYSNGEDSTLDSHVQNLVTLFVFSGFALQLEIYNRLSDFDGTSDLKSHYMILDEGEELEESQETVKNEENFENSANGFVVDDIKSPPDNSY